MNKLKYRVGDRVKIRKGTYLWGDSKTDKIYTIIEIGVSPCQYLLHNPTGTTHISYNGKNPGWWYSENDLEITHKQMMFSFMYE